MQGWISILSAVISVVTGVATAMTMVDPVWKKRLVLSLILLGVVWISLSIATDDKATAAVLAAIGFGGALLQRIGQLLITIPGVILLTFAATVATVILVQRIPWHQIATNRPDPRTWGSGLQIMFWAGEEMLAAREAAIQKHNERTEAWLALDRKAAEIVAGMAAFSAFSDPTPELAEARRTATAAQHEMGIAKNELDAVKRRILSRLYEELQDGKLIAKGFLPPFTHQSVDVDIPPEQWRFLRFDDDMQNASGHDVTYIGVKVSDPAYGRKNWRNFLWSR